MVVQLQRQQTFKKRQSTSQLQSLSGLIFPSCVPTYTGSTLLNNTCHILDSTSFGRDDGFQERSDVDLLQLLFGLSFVPHHTSEFLADTPITRFSFDQVTCTLSKRQRLPQPITSISCCRGLLMFPILVTIKLLHLLQFGLGCAGG